MARRYRNVARPGDEIALADLAALMTRAHAALDDRDRCLRDGRPWPTPAAAAVRLHVLPARRTPSVRRLIVRGPSNG